MQNEPRLMRAAELLNEVVPPPLPANVRIIRDKVMVDKSPNSWISVTAGERQERLRKKILDYLTRSKEPRTLSDIARTLRAGKTSVATQLDALVEDKRLKRAIVFRCKVYTIKT